jgi:hypothetical protein
MDTKATGYLYGLKSLMPGRIKAHVAESIQVSMPTLRGFINCQVSPSVKVTEKLMEYFGVDFERLIVEPESNVVTPTPAPDEIGRAE